MEVVLTNLPHDLSGPSLKKELQPILNSLGTRAWDYDKPKKGQHAYVTFLYAQDGAKFLEKHGQLIKNSSPHVQEANAKRSRGALARLFILGRPIFVQKSTRTVDVDTLKNLEYLQSKRNHDHEVRRDPTDPTLHCKTGRLSCGKIIVDNGVFAFASQTTRNTSHGIEFGQKFAILSATDKEVAYISYRNVQECIVDSHGKSFTFILENPPRFYRRDISDAFSVVSVGSDRKSRLSSLESIPNHEKYVAHCLVYRVWCLDPDFSDVVKRLKSREIGLGFSRMPVQERPAYHIHDYSTTMDSFEGRLSRMANSSRLIHYTILFQVQALVWNNYLHPRAGTDLLSAMEIVASERKLAGKEIPFTTEAVKTLFQNIPYPVTGIEPADLDVRHLLEQVCRAEVTLSEGMHGRDPVYGAQPSPQHAFVLKAMVTPTRIVLHGPDAESKNRVLRLFPDRHDYFLRVSFCDEDGTDLGLNPKVSNEEIFQRFKRVLRSGITVAGRKYEFLGFSHSSLRSHSTWFVAPFIDSELRRQSYETIMERLGDFSHIQIPAKCAARMGQAFSETPFSVPLKNIVFRYVPDVKSKDGSRTFSDGVGTISRGALEEVWGYLPASLNHPTCIQIRLGGIKGMLSLDTRLSGSCICFRKESMMKFPSTDNSELGICDTSSRPLRFVLNRQLIKIMEDMGTKDSWFFAQQKLALEFLKGATSNARNTSTFLKSQAIGQPIRLPKLITKLGSIGIDYRQDRFLRAVVNHVVLRELRLLKHKARIPVRQGITLFGVMDETGLLGEDEIYVTFDANAAKKHGVCKSTLKEGLVLVTRSPALHPGDVQVVTMKQPPPGSPLLALQNCIVFSQHGVRDLPSKLSGGDLDGDLYSVIWDQDAMPQHMFTPADYPRATPQTLGRAVTREDITDFFINFMKADVLGIIASRHQVYCDIDPEGTRAKESILLAALHSTAVDYSKTGTPVELKSIPKGPRTRPDFLAPSPPLKLYDVGQVDFLPEANDDDDDEGDDGMGPPRYKYHLSEKVLGRLFRAVDEKSIWKHDIEREPTKSAANMWWDLLLYVRRRINTLGIGHCMDYERRMDHAWKLRDLYETSLHDKMWQFSDNPRSQITEVEAFCGSIFNSKGSQTRRQRDTSIKLGDDIDRLMTWIKDLMEEDDDDDDYGEDLVIRGFGLTGAQTTLEISLACVHAGCKDTSKETARHGCKPLESFRIIAACTMLKTLEKLEKIEHRRQESNLSVGREDSPMLDVSLLGLELGEQGEQTQLREEKPELYCLGVYMHRD